MVISQEYTIINNSLNNELFNNFNYNVITNSEILDKYVRALLENFKTNPSEYIYYETHQYTMILPEKYYGPGSYYYWIRVGWALKNTSHKMFLTWIKFSSQSSEFNYNDSFLF